MKEHLEYIRIHDIWLQAVPSSMSFVLKARAVALTLRPLQSSQVWKTHEDLKRQKTSPCQSSLSILSRAFGFVLSHVSPYPSRTLSLCFEHLRTTLSTWFLAHGNCFGRRWLANEVPGAHRCTIVSRFGQSHPWNRKLNKLIWIYLTMVQEIKAYCRIAQGNTERLSPALAANSALASFVVLGDCMVHEITSVLPSLVQPNWVFESLRGKVFYTTTKTKLFPVIAVQRHNMNQYEPILQEWRLRLPWVRVEIRFWPTTKCSIFGGCDVKLHSCSWLHADLRPRRLRSTTHGNGRRNSASVESDEHFEIYIRMPWSVVGVECGCIPLSYCIISYHIRSHHHIRS